MDKYFKMSLNRSQSGSSIFEVNHRKPALTQSSEWKINVAENGKPQRLIRFQAVRNFGKQK